MSYTSTLAAPTAASSGRIGMKYAAIVALILASGCSSSPSAPTPMPTVSTPPVVVTPPATTPPVVTTPAPVIPAFPPADARFDLAFYRQFVHNALESPTRLEPLRRQRDAPRIYLRTIDDAGSAIDAFTLNQTAAALESTAGMLTGVFGVAAIGRGTETRVGQPGWVTVRWSSVPEIIDMRTSVCGRGSVGGDNMTLYPRSPGCRCPGGPAGALDRQTRTRTCPGILAYRLTRGFDVSQL